MIPRKISSIINEKLYDKKIIIITGARQTGKTTLLKDLFGNDNNSLWLNADQPDVQSIFENANSDVFKDYFGKNKFIIIDEAQRIKNVGLKLKIIADELPEYKLIVTGSSSFELANEINEPLTGRKWEYSLYPLSFEELLQHNGLLSEKRYLHRRLIYGSYPDVVTNTGQEKEILKQITDSYLFKDILMWQHIKKSEKLIKLLQALALQVGSEVSYNELGKLVGLDNVTVEKYIQLLEKVFVIFRLKSLKRNGRKELKFARKIYFYDNGVRNALIANFQQLELRQDTGALWENYLVSERIKLLHYNKIWANVYFWRTHDQQEIDYVEEIDGLYHAYEFKWSPKTKVKFSKSFTSNYQHTTNVVNRDNYYNFIRYKK
ncbi:MAG: ATP-binding protein [Bacteroidota bacterium]